MSQFGRVRDHPGFAGRPLPHPRRPPARPGRLRRPAAQPQPLGRPARPAPEQPGRRGEGVEDDPGRNPRRPPRRPHRRQRRREAADPHAGRRRPRGRPRLVVHAEGRPRQGRRRRKPTSTRSSRPSASPTHNHGDPHAGHDHGDEAKPEPSASASASTEAQPGDAKLYKLANHTLPAGWVSEQSDRPFRVATFFTGTGNDRAELIVSKLPGDRFGTMLDNINRWRREVGLPDAKDEGQQPVRKITLAGHDAALLSFDGPDSRRRSPWSRSGARRGSSS